MQSEPAIRTNIIASILPKFTDPNINYSGMPLVHWAIESNLDSDALRLL
jgi:hypothetical protein